MVGMWLGLAWAVSVQVPVAGVVADGGGAPLTGARSVAFVLETAAGTEVFRETQSVLFADGSFSARLGENGLLGHDLFSTSGLALRVVVDGVASAPVTVGVAPYAAHAEDAARLGGHDASTYVRHVDGSVPWSRLAAATVPAGLADGDDDTRYSASGAGLSLAGTAFSVDHAALTPAWSNIQGRPAGLDDGDAVYTASGAGLSLSGTAFSVDHAALTPSWSNVQSKPAWYAESTETAFRDRVRGYVNGAGDLTFAGGIDVGAATATCGAGTRGLLSYHTNRLWACTEAGWVGLTGYTPAIFHVYPSAHLTNQAGGHYTVRHDSVHLNTQSGAFTLNSDWSVTVHQTGYYEVEIRALIHKDSAMSAHTRLMTSNNNGATWDHAGWLDHGGSGQGAGTGWTDYLGARKMEIPAGTRLQQWTYNGAFSSYPYHSGSANTDYTYMRIERLDRP